MAGANWFDVGSFGLGAIGNIAGGYLQGQGQKAGMEALAKSNKEAARMGQMGSMLALSDAQAARAGQYGQNVFGQLAGSLFNMPIDFAFQRMGRERELSTYKPWEQSLQRDEDRIREEEQQTPLFRGGRQKEAAEQLRLAGKYAGLENMSKYGPFSTFTS
jgi:hypothetical protein